MNTRCNLSRRAFIHRGAKVAAATGLHAGLCGTGRAQSGSEIDSFNYVIGTQSIGATYQFSEESVLVETARAVLDMGSNLFKFTMGRGYQRMMLKATKAAYPETMQYLLNQGADARHHPRREYPGASQVEPQGNPEIKTLTDLARLEPSYRRVFEMPFAYYHIWTYAFTPNWWHKGFPPEDQEKEYDEIYALVSHLLKTYSGTSKAFLLGHWEGDWHLRPDLNYQTDENVRPEMVQGMTRWLNTRQKAIDDAKRETPHGGVGVFHYCELNHVAAIAMEGRVCVANSILPNTNIDYVGYSTYDCLGDIGKLPKALDYLDSKLTAKPEIAGKRVFIGEYGFPARRVPEAERDRKSRGVMHIGLEWGCPFVLCWQMYNNEFKDGAENGYWLIDDKGVKQPLWHTHHSFYRAARQYVADFRQKEQRLPTAEEFRAYAITLLR